MDEQTQLKAVRHIFNQVVPYYDLLNRVLSLREDVRWRRFVALSLRPGPTGRVLDVACGTGDLALAIAARPDQPQVVGLDLVPAMLGPARKKAPRAGGRLSLLAGDATRLPFADQSFDSVTIAFGIRNIPRRIEAMAEMKRVLTPGGRLHVLEFATSQKPWVRAFYTRYLAHLLPGLGGLISGDRASYEYLAETILEFPAPAAFRAEMLAAGLAVPRSFDLTRGIAWMHVAERPGGVPPRP
jgi:demethylmenaquinone methyltransferase / 2-methoxy-6-polyprenyl-1,4-benzoquinol methylase